MHALVIKTKLGCLLIYGGLTHACNGRPYSRSPKTVLLVTGSIIECFILCSSYE